MDSSEKLPFVLENVKNIIGSGSYGKVYATGNILYVYKKFGTENTFTSFTRELSVMKTLKSNSNVIDCFSIICNLNHQKIGYFMPKYETDLHYYTFFKKIEIGEAKDILYKILLGLYEAHYKFICHGDIKPGNILIDNKKDSVILADWGISVFTLFKKTKKIQTLCYRAPEILLGETEYDLNIDIWSVALIFIKMISGNSPPNEYNNKDQLYRIFELFGTPNEKSWPGIENLPEYSDDFPKHEYKNFIESIISDSNLANLIKNMLILNPKKRFTVSQALNHKTFQDHRSLKNDQDYRSLKNDQDLFPGILFQDFESNNFQNIIKKLNSLPTLKRNPNYIEEIQNDMMVLYRDILLDWLAGICLKFKFNDEIFYLGVYYLDYVLGHLKINGTKLQLLGLTCLHLASSIYDTNYLKIDDCEYLCDDRYTETHFKKCANKVLSCLNYNLYYVTDRMYYMKYSQLFEFDTKKYCFGKLILVNAIMSYDYLKYNIKHIVIGTSIICKYYDSGKEMNSKDVIKKLYIEDNDVTFINDAISFLIKIYRENQNKTKLNPYFKKYKSNSFLEVSNIKLTNPEKYML